MELPETANTPKQNKKVNPKTNDVGNKTGKKGNKQLKQTKNTPIFSPDACTPNNKKEPRLTAYDFGYYRVGYDDLSHHRYSRYRVTVRPHYKRQLLDQERQEALGGAPYW